MRMACRLCSLGTDLPRCPLSSGPAPLLTQRVLLRPFLPPGLKRHAVTLFEGGRVAGESLISEVAAELWASYAAGQGFEGDMARLTQVMGPWASRACVA